MFVNLKRGATTISLAGGNGVSSETQNFRISCEGVFQKADYIEANQAAQFFRGGSMVSVSFDSQITFANLGAAETYLLETPEGFINQAGQTVEIGSVSPTVKITLENVSCVLSLAQKGVTVYLNVNILGTYQ